MWADFVLKNPLQVGVELTGPTVNIARVTRSGRVPTPPKQHTRAEYRTLTPQTFPPVRLGNTYQTFLRVRSALGWICSLANHVCEADSANPIC